MNRTSEIVKHHQKYQHAHNGSPIKAKEKGAERILFL